MQYILRKGVFCLLNYIWIGLIAVSCIYGFLSGKGEDLANGFTNGAAECVQFVLKIGSFMIMWQGFLTIAEKSGLSKKLALALSPVITFVFKGLKKGSRAVRLISNNITANVLGLSNAATPLGMEAMKELAKKSQNNTATNHMCLLAVINSASLQLIPSTLIALRTSYSSVLPADITVPVWVTSALTVVFAVIITKIMEKHTASKEGILS